MRAYAVAALHFGGLALDIAEIHEGLGEKVALVPGIWVVIRAAVWWFKVEIKAPPAFVFPLVAIVTAPQVAFTTYHGGQMMFDLGVNATKAASGG